MNAPGLFQQYEGYVSVGYEDGHAFEEISKVRIEGQVDEPEEIIAPENFAVQQQQ
jgi:hypothetical protein